MQEFSEYLLTLSKYGIVIFSLLTVFRCLRSMLSDRYEPEVWAVIHRAGGNIPVTHWESIIGRGPAADIRITGAHVSRVHAVLVRDDRGIWRIFDVFSRGGVWVNERREEYNGSIVKDGDILHIAANEVKFIEPEEERMRRLECSRHAAGAGVSGWLTLLWLSLFQLSLLCQHLMFISDENRKALLLSFAAIIILEWFCFSAMRLINRSGFEIETLAFYLTTLGLSTVATAKPEELYSTAFHIILSVLMFFLLGWWLRNLRRTSAIRLPIAIASLGLLAVNYFFGKTMNGATNWLQIGGISFQPSELVKVMFIYVGASTLDRLYMKSNLYTFVAYSAACVLALALMGDFGSALVFFVAFLVISFMRSGSLATVVLSVSAAVIAALIAITSKEYIAVRFASCGHAWDDIYGQGYQQVRAMSASAAGGLFGKGAGSGWLAGITAADTDMVMAVVCEELGLLEVLAVILALAAIAVFAVRAARRSRSAYYAIAACATATIMLTQAALNFFGSMDILPFTGVTFPFVSNGGTSLMACWMMTAFIKSADNRREASFAVKRAESYSRPEADEAYSDDSTVPEQEVEEL